MRHTRPEKGQPSVIQAVIHCQHQYETTFLFCFLGSSENGRMRGKGFLQARREVGGVAGNWLVKVYKQSEEEVQEAEW